MVKTVVILGGALGGLPVAHHLLKHTAPLVEDLKVILVTPNSDFFWNLASVRGILPDMLEDDKLFYPIAPAFTQYPSHKFEFVLGKAEALDPGKNAVTVKTNDGQTRQIPYHTLLIATGSKAREGMPFKNLSSTEDTKAKIHEWQAKIKAARSIIVAGAGMTGVETAGELAEEYSKTGLKQITVVNDGLPFADNVRKDIRKGAVAELEKLGARYIDAKVTAVSDHKGQKLVDVALPDGSIQTLVTDLYLPAYGVVANTEFVPAHMLDKQRRIKQTTSLKAEGYDNIFVVGDAGNLESQTAVTINNQLGEIVRGLQARLTGKSAPAPEYKPANKTVFAVSIGKNGGIGQLGNWKLFSLMVWFAKARTLMTEKAADTSAGKVNIS